MKIGKIILAVVGVLLAVFFAAAIAVGYWGLDYNWGTEYKALNKDTNARLTEDGDLIVEETIHYKFNRPLQPLPHL